MNFFYFIKEYFIFIVCKTERKIKMSSCPYSRSTSDGYFYSNVACAGQLPPNYSPSTLSYDHVNNVCKSSDGQTKRLASCPVIPDSCNDDVTKLSALNSITMAPDDVKTTYNGGYMCKAVNNKI